MNDTNLTAYWRRKKQAVLDLFAAAPNNQSAQTLKAWVDGIANAQQGGRPSYEQALNDALQKVKEKRAAVTQNNGGPRNRNRRSSRLIRTVQGAIGAVPDGDGFFASVGSIAGPGNGNGGGSTVPGLTAYLNEVENASAAAADFLEAAKNRDPQNGAGAGPAGLLAALGQIISSPPQGLGAVVLDELEGLSAAIAMYSARGGSGEGSGYWPSSFISSSSTSGK